MEDLQLQPIATEIIASVNDTVSVDEYMAEYENIIIEKYPNQELCRKTISDIKTKLSTFIESIKDSIQAFADGYREEQSPGRVEELKEEQEGGRKRRKQRGGELTEPDIFMGFAVFFVLLAIVQICQLLAIILGTSGEYIGMLIGVIFSKLFPPKKGRPAMVMDYSNTNNSGSEGGPGNPMGPKGGKKSRRQRRRKSVKRR